MVEDQHIMLLAWHHTPVYIPAHGNGHPAEAEAAEDLQYCTSTKKGSHNCISYFAILR